MKVSPVGIVVVVTGLIVPGLFGGAMAVEPHAPSTDTRQRLVLGPAQRQMMLAEMRLMLESVSGILQGLASGDRPAAEKSARRSGMTGSADMDPHIQTRLPRQFLELAIHTHRGFDTLADQIKAGRGQVDILRELARLTGNCVACHAAYRLDEGH